MKCANTACPNEVHAGPVAPIKAEYCWPCILKARERVAVWRESAEARRLADILNKERE